VIAQREHLSAARQVVTVTAGGRASLEFELTIEALHENISVTASASGTSTTFDAVSSIASLDSLDLAQRRGATVAEALAGEPGIALRSFGPGSARPIIRGFDGDRVLIMQDGVRTGDLSSQSGDHGVSLDPASLERLEVVKGPATLLYGSNAIGGVVNAITPQEMFRTSPFDGVLGGLALDTASNNGQFGGAGNVQYGNGPWMVWGGGGARRSGDYNSPLGVVDNSGTDLRTGRFGVGWTGQRAYVSAGGQIERHRFGVPFADALHAHTHGDAEAHEDEDAFEIDLLSNRREVRMDAGVRHLDNSFIDNVRFTAAGTAYSHDELEVSAGREVVGTQLRNDTRSARLEFEQKRTGRLTGRLGIDWLGRDYRATGAEALSPRTRQQALSAFAYEELGLGRVRLQFGGRLEHTRFRPGERPASGHVHGAHDAEDEGHDDEDHDHGEEHEHEAPAVRDRNFTAASGSFGVHTDIGHNSAVVVNLTTASRAPAIEELFNFGPHVGNLAYEIGNPGLNVERTLGVDLALRRRAERVSGELSAFVYNVRDYVYLDFTGIEVDGLREAEFRQGDARYSGAEASTDIELGGHVHLEASVSAVRATLTATGEHLPRIPPVSGRIRLEVPWKGLAITPEVVVAAAQTRVFRDESATDGYALLNLGASYFVVRGHATHQITLTGRNLTNTTYRHHTSFLKDVAPEMGRSIKLTYSVRFF
jgi:iron complex outermembrane receptor protein